MLTYQVRPRTFRHEAGKPLDLPAKCEIRFHFRPGQAFGVQAGGGRTAVRAVPARALFNANSGEHTIESADPLKPLDVTIAEPSRGIRLSGAMMTITETVDRLRDLEELIRSVYFGLPPLLNVAFADPPIIERVDGNVGGNQFGWELSSWTMDFRTTTQEVQEAAFAESWLRLGLIAASHRRRLIAGLHYFHVACRLARRAETAGEFVAEVVLNLGKTLEVLFPPAGDGRSRDAARVALRALGFGESEIEGNFIPAMALRSEIDVAHVELGLFKVDQLKIIHAFTERAENAFRDMFARLLERVKAGSFDVAAYTTGLASDEAIAVVERLRQHTPAAAV